MKQFGVQLLNSFQIEMAETGITEIFLQKICLESFGAVPPIYL